MKKKSRGKSCAHMRLQRGASFMEETMQDQLQGFSARPRRRLPLSDLKKLSSDKEKITVPEGTRNGSSTRDRTFGVMIGELLDNSRIREKPGSLSACFLSL